MKKNDPGTLRIAAVNLLVNILSQLTSAGVWTFGQYVNELIAFRKLMENGKRTHFEIVVVSIQVDYLQTLAVH